MPKNRGSSEQGNWTPPPRPEWVARINEEGSYTDIKSLVPLRAESLIETAIHKTGLSDFGGDAWREPFEVICSGLDEEAELHLMGRLMLRTEMLLALEGRLQIEEIYKRHPEIDDQEINKPLFIIGQGRSGTSALFNMLSMDPKNGALLTWEAMFPCPPPVAATYDSDSRIEMADKLATQQTRVCPEIAAIHELGGRLPTECIQLMVFSFTSFWFNTLAQLPSYAAYLVTADWEEAFRYHKRTLKLLQWKKPRRWLSKSPEHLHRIPTILKVYPDACFIWPHRDPVKSRASVANLTRTVNYRSSDNPEITTFENYTDASNVRQLLEAPIEMLESGLLTPDRLCNVQYNDIVEDPISVIESIYEHFDITYNEENLAFIKSYVSENPRSSRPQHKYSVGDDDSVAAERALYKKYQDYFDVPNEA